MRVQSLSWEDTLEEDMATTPVFFPRELQGQKSPVGYTPQGYEELDTTEMTWHAHT